MYKHIAALWKKPKENMGSVWTRKLIAWRREGAITRAARPTRPDRARALGYKSKQGFVIARTRISKGKRKRPKPSGGRRPKRAGRFFSTSKAKQWIAEERVSRKFQNLEVLNSYYVGEDGMHVWYEVILVDPDHPNIRKDRDISWICEPQHRGRVSRGLTSAGKKSRGLRRKGIGSEKTRPSLGAKKHRGK
jgi:large subunit ribosomal protein L15e